MPFANPLHFSTEGVDGFIVMWWLIRPLITGTASGPICPLNDRTHKSRLNVLSVVPRLILSVLNLLHFRGHSST